MAFAVLVCLLLLTIIGVICSQDEVTQCIDGPLHKDKPSPEGSEYVSSVCLGKINLAVPRNLRKSCKGTKSKYYITSRGIIATICLRPVSSSLKTRSVFGSANPISSSGIPRRALWIVFLFVQNTVMTGLKPVRTTWRVLRIGLTGLTLLQMSTVVQPVQGVARFPRCTKMEKGCATQCGENHSIMKPAKIVWWWNFPGRTPMMQ